jgi:NTE family protein
MSLEIPELALVLPGGGARAAYQVGILRALARRFPTLDPPILTGVSAGAINIAWLASRRDLFRQRVESLTEAWQGLTTDQVFHVDSFSLGKNLVRAGSRLVSGGTIERRRRLALVDTQPLREFLQRTIGGPDGRLTGIADNLANGALRAVALTASSYSTGQSITWVESSAPAVWERAHRRSVGVELTVDHVMASAALPLLFPAVQVNGAWFGDGGLQLTAPLSPAIHLGAGRILAVSTRYRRTKPEAETPVVDGYPPPVQIAGMLLNAIFIDALDADALVAERINRLIAAMSEAQRSGLRPIELLVLRPSCDLGKLANAYEARLPRAFRFLTRGLGTQETRRNDLLSLLMFQKDYLSRLMEIGEADGQAQIEEVAAFLRSEPSA